MKNDIKLLDNKILVLYVLENTNGPLSIEEIAKLCIDFEDVSYFDICDYITILLRENFVQEVYINENTAYEITEAGVATLNELLDLIPGISIFNLKKMVQKELVNLKNSFTINTETIPINHSEYNVSCFIKDRKDELINITLFAGDKEQARKIVNNWQNNAEEIYAAVLGMLTKEEDKN